MMARAGVTTPVRSAGLRPPQLGRRTTRGPGPGCSLLEQQEAPHFSLLSFLEREQLEARSGGSAGARPSCSSPASHPSCEDTDGVCPAFCDLAWEEARCLACVRGRAADSLPTH